MMISAQGLRNDKENNEERSYTFEYDFFGRIASLLFRVIAIFIGYVMLLMGKEVIILFVSGILFILYGLYSFIDILLFQKLIINKNLIIKQWYIFGKRELPIDSLIITKVNFPVGGIIGFKNNKRRLESFLFKIYTLPLGRNQISDIKTILMNLKIIKGDEYDWID